MIKLSSLTTLKLSFRSTLIIDNDSSDFFFLKWTLSKLSKLEHLDIDFSLSNETPQFKMFYELGQGLKSLKKLKTFKLNLKNQVIARN